MNRRIFFTITLIFCLSAAAAAQTTAFTYQGQLDVSGSPANGNYDFEFLLFDGVAGGTQLGTTLTRTNVAVADGAFTVSLDFGGVFPGANRFLEINVRQAGGGAYTTLQPRQPVTSTPYAIKSLNAETSVNATQLGGVEASQYVTTDNGGTNFIRNSQTQQASSNFNISGTGTANIVNAATQFNIGGNRVLSTPGLNVFAGRLAGQAHTLGFGNSFFGFAAGSSNTSAPNNSFFGSDAGTSNTSGSFNSFFGSNAGFANISGSNNAFFGVVAGQSNLGDSNAFFGRGAGFANTTGSFNSFFGTSAGNANTTGSNNTTIGAHASVSNNLTNATAIGHRATVATSNSLVLGSINGLNGATQTINVGIGTASPTERLHVVGTGRFTGALAVQGNLSVSSSLSVNQNINVLGNLGVSTLAVGATSVCRTAIGVLSNCSSSARYKTNVVNFSSGLDMINRLRPVSFNWKQDDMLDLGLVAEDVAEIEPLLVTYNDQGEIEGVKYDRIGVVLINAVREQQAIIERQQAEIDELKQLRAVVCELIPSAAVCGKQDRR